MMSAIVQLITRFNLFKSSNKHSNCCPLKYAAIISGRALSSNFLYSSIDDYAVEIRNAEYVTPISFVFAYIHFVLL